MWLVQLYKADDNATEGLYSTNECNTNYIDPQVYTPDSPEITLCNDWDDPSKRGILILKKIPEALVIRPLQNERFMYYFYYIMYNSQSAASYIISLEYLENGDFFIDFYVGIGIYIQFNIPAEILSAPNPVLYLLQYIKGKTLNIGIIGNETPKYSIVFDDTCKYYHYDNPYSGYVTIWVMKKPFLFLMLLVPGYNFVFISVGIKPRLIEEFNNYDITQSNYEPDNDPPIKIDNIINQYFDSNNKVGLSRNGVDLNDNTDNFSYNLIRALLGTFKNDLIQNYYFSLDGNTGTLYPSDSDYMPLDETPACIYFPLFRPQLDNNGFNMTWPQYDPNDTSKYVYNLYLSISLNNNGEVEYSSLTMGYGNSLSNQNYCYTNPSGYMSSWRFDTCDLTLPFRFAGATDCTATDYWDNDTIRNNANYLFLIVKPSSSDTSTYNIKGVGCDELTSDISSFSDFSADYEFRNSIDPAVMNEIRRITFSESGWPIEAISNTLESYGVRNNETCFVLFNESLIENASDFLSIYQAVTAPLSNAIVCYIGSSETVPDTYRNKIIHSDAVVTDLDTNERMPIVIKYIKYAKRLYELFNG